MPELTYKDLYTQVIREIEKREGYNILDDYKDELEGAQIGNIGFNKATESNISISEVGLTNAIYNVLEDVVPQQIKSGLNVEETDPVSNKVKVTAGTGMTGGSVYSLNKDATIEVPFDSTTYIFYICLFVNGVKVLKTPESKVLRLAKVIVPEPGMTDTIRNHKDDGEEGDAYIINLKEYKLHGDANGNFEEDTIELLRNNITPILSDNLIGNLKLSEDLKITNTAGTLELNSDSMILKDLDGNQLSKFNRKGVYFYDTSGIEKARFTKDDARVGNILVTKNTIQSEDFSSGLLGYGFRIKDNGNAEFNDVFIRGKMGSSVLEYNSVSANAGNLLVSYSADKLASDMTGTSTTLNTDGDVVFASGDILWLKDKSNEEYMTVSSVTDSSTYTVTRASGGTAAAWKKGTAVVNLGQSGDGGLFLTASETNAPYMSVYTHSGSPWSGLDTKIRIGNLNGFLGYSTDKYGIAIGETNKYLKYDPTNGLRIKGSVTVTGGSLNADYIDAGTLTGITIQGNTIRTASSGSRIVMDTDKFSAYNNASGGGNEIFKINLTGNDVGDILFGDTSKTNGYIQWDNSASTLIVADLESPDYVAGTTGYKLSSTEGLEINTGDIAFPQANFAVAASDSSHGGTSHYICDGTSDQVEINTAISNLPANGGTILLLEGNYYLDGSINIATNNIRIIGSGVGTVLTIPASYDSNLDMIYVHPDANAFYIKDVMIDGNQGSQASGTQTAIHVDAPDATPSGGDCKIDRAYTYNFRGYGMLIENDSIVISNSSIKACGYDGTSQGIKVTGKRDYLLGCMVEDNRQDGLTIEGRGQYIVVTGSHFNDNDGSGMKIMTNDNTIVGNMCKNNGTYGIAISGDHNLIEDNAVQGNSQTTDDTYNNIELASIADYNLIQGNLVRHGGATKQAQYGIHIQGTENLVTNNDLKNAGRTADWADGGTDTIVSSNRTTNDYSAKYMNIYTDHIYEQTTGDGVTVDGNILRDANVFTDAVQERTADTGVDIDTMLVMDGTINFKDVNYINNFYFYNWTSGVPNNWSNTAGSVSEETTTVYKGSSSAKLVSGASNEAKIEQSVDLWDLFPGNKFELRARVYCVGSAQGYISVWDTVNFFSASATQTGQWEEVIITDVVDGAATDMKIICGVNTGSYTVYFDNIRLTFAE